jgi:hypothetical protein
MFDVVPTIHDLAEVLTEVAGTDLRGVVFNMTSVNHNPWYFSGSGDDDGRPFNFNTDKVNRNNNAPVEMFGAQWNPTQGESHAEV